MSRLVDVRIKKPVAVVATIAAGCGIAAPAWAYFSSTTDEAKPAVTASTLGAPTAVSASAGTTSTSMKVTISGGPSSPAATGYNVYKAGTTSPLLCQAGSTLPSSCTSMGLTPNTSYQFDVYSTLSNWISPAKATTASATTSRQNTTTTLSNITPTSGTAGTTSFSATATVAGNDGYGTPAGSVVFSLYTTSNCSGTASQSTSAQTLVSGSVTGSMTPSAAGTYYWQAAYTPTDSYNNASTSTCSSTSITVSAAASVTPTEVDHNGSSGNYVVKGTVTGSTSVSVTVYSSYNTATCTAGTVVGTQSATITSGTWTSNTFGLSAGTDYVKVVGSNPSVTSKVYSFAVPTGQGASTTSLTNTGC